MKLRKMVWASAEGRCAVPYGPFSSHSTSEGSVLVRRAERRTVGVLLLSFVCQNARTASNAAKLSVARRLLGSTLAK